MENKTPEKIVIGSETGKKVNCSMCKKEGATDQFVALQGAKGASVYVCAECRQKANAEFEAETKNQNVPLGIAGGIVGAVIAGFVWYFVAVGTGKEIGYISLGLGYLVGMGVHIGAGKKRGHNLQVISAVIAAAAIFVTQKFVYDFFLNQYAQAHLTEYPQLAGQVLSASFFDTDFLSALTSPMGLLIYALGIYFAYKVCKAKKI
jgi:hypothetical protein